MSNEQFYILRCAVVTFLSRLRKFSGLHRIEFYKKFTFSVIDGETSLKIGDGSCMGLASASTIIDIF